MSRFIKNKNNDNEKTIREFPEKIRISIGSAAVLGLEKIKIKVAPTTCYLMLYTEYQCKGKCLFCPQGSWTNERDAKKLSRVIWPAYSFNKFIERLNENQKLMDDREIDEKYDKLNNISKEINKKNNSNLNSKFKRVCIQVLNVPGFEEDILNVIKIIHDKHPNLKISAAIPPINKETMYKLKEFGLERIGLAIDACTPELFYKIKGKGANGPYNWEDHWNALRAALEVFGEGFVTTHLIIGMGENEYEAIKMLDYSIKNRILPGLFMFTPVQHTPMEKAPRPNITRFRRIQLVRSLLLKQKKKWEDLVFDDKNKLIKIKGFKTEDLWKEIKKQFAFKTAGCPGCNRPYYTSRPGEEPDGFPRDITEREQKKIFEELKNIIDN